MSGVSTYSKRIVDQQNRSYDCSDLLDGEAGNIRDQTGKEITFEQLLVGSTVSVLLEKGSASQVNSIVKGREDISGQIEMENRSENIIVLNGDTFYYNASYLGQSNRFRPEAGAEVTLKLDFLG